MKQSKTKTLLTRVTQKDYNVVLKKVKKSDLNLSEYLRLKILS